VAKKRGSCGVGWCSLPNNHPFEPACQQHDLDYDYVCWQSGTKEIDKAFYAACIEIAECSGYAQKSQKWLKMQARLFYYVTRIYGAAKRLYKISNIGKRIKDFARRF
jgi:hypothetical protein